MLQRLLHRVFRYFIKGYPVNLLPVFFQVQRIGQMPGNRLPLTVRVRCQIYFFRFFYFLTKIRQDVPLTADSYIFRFIIMVDINSKLAFWQITYMSVTGRHLIIRAKELLNCFYLCG